jgi:hypothetical protein
MVRFELLVPGMQHAEEADLSAETARGARDFEQGFGAGTKQQVVDKLLVLQRERRQYMWEREDHMHVARRQKFPAARLDPSVARVGLTLGAVSVSTRVVRDGGATPATGALIDVATEGCCSAALNRQQDFHMLPSEPPAAPLDKCVSATSSGGRGIYSSCVGSTFSWSASSGLAVALRWRWERCR